MFAPAVGRLGSGFRRPIVALASAATTTRSRREDGEGVAFDVGRGGGGGGGRGRMMTRRKKRRSEEELLFSQPIQPLSKHGALLSSRSSQCIKAATLFA